MDERNYSNIGFSTDESNFVEEDEEIIELIIQDNVNLLEAIKNTDMQLLTEIDLKNINDIKIKYDDRITFAVGSLTNIETKLARGLAALEKENEINAYSEGTLDLKTEPYVYFKSGSDKKEKKETAKK